MAEQEPQALSSTGAFALGEDDAERFSDLLAEHCGVRIDERERRKLALAVASRAQAIGCDPPSYFARVTSPQVDRAELDRLAVRLTVGETSFFRSPPHFEALRQFALPLLTGNREDARVRVLSAGCSTGEEAWSIAISLREALGRAARLEVLGVDLDGDAVEIARRGVYGDRAMRRVPDWLRAQYFEEVGTDWRVSETLRSWVSFERGNLKEWPPESGQPFDAIFCRNTLIYFERREIVLALRRFARLLRPGGFLLLGQTEAIFGQLGEFDVVEGAGGFLFRRRETPRARTPLPPTAKIKTPEPPPVKIATPAPPPTKPPTPEPGSKLQAPGSRSDSGPEAEPEASRVRVPSVRELAAIVAEPRRPSTVPPTAPPRTEADLIARAVDMVKRENLDGALELFARVPDSALAQLGRAFVLASRDADADARVACDHALELDPFLPEGYFLSGILLEKIGDRAGAERQYLRTLLLDRDFALAWFYLGNLYLREGNLRAARREFNRALKITERKRNPPGALRRLFSDEAVQDFCRRRLHKDGK
jgi:chemotaxis protein methyltransferase CheR